MVAPTVVGAAARLLSRREPGRAALLDLSRRRNRRRPRRAAQLVHPRAVRLMPEKTAFSRVKLVRTGDMPPPPTTPSAYVELGVTSPFSFLRGASNAIELALTGLGQGYDAIGIADRNTLAGVVRMYSACKNAGLRPLIGCRLDLAPLPLAGGVGGGPVSGSVHNNPSPSALRASSPPACGRGVSLLAY